MNALLHRLISFFRRLRHLDRMEWVFAVFVCFGLYILWATLRYTVLEYGYYSGLADRQHTMELTDPVSRGTIFSDNEPEGIFAMSTSLPDLAVDPMQAGSKDRLVDFVSDIITDELCVYDGIDKCYENLRSFLRVTEIPDYDASPEFARKLVGAAVATKVNQEYVTREVIATEVTPEICAGVNEAKMPGVTCDDNATVAADPTLVSGSGSTAAMLVKLTGVGEADAIAKRLVPKRVRYVRLYRRLNLRSKEKIDERVANEKNAISKGLLDAKDAIYPFIILESYPTRFYPEHSIASKISGFVDRDNHGRYGIEGYFDRELRGRDGLKVTKKDATGRAIGTYDLDEQDIVDGTDIRLTIDRNIQKEISKLLAESIEKFQANK
jgi:cell division protein FtsI/penicillin-binding protein 2